MARETLKHHDAIISRYDADGMASLEVHQDTTDFTFTIALNPASEYAYCAGRADPSGPKPV